MYLKDSMQYTQSIKSASTKIGRLLLKLLWQVPLIVFVALLLPMELRSEIAKTPMINYRGINLAFQGELTDKDIAKLAGWGVNVVRIVVHADPERKNNGGFYLKDGKSFNEQAFEKLDRLIARLAVHQIRVVLDMHSFPGHGNGMIWKEFRYWDQLEKLWSFIAQRYRGNSAVLAYDVMNEPTLVLSEGSAADRSRMRLGMWSIPENWTKTPRDYFALVERIGQAINRIDPAKTVIVEGVGLWGSPVNFNWMRPVNIQNVVYSFHMYVPHKFADAGKDGREVVAYSRKKSRAQVLEAMEPVTAFARKFNAQIYVGELGLPYYSEGMGAADWLHDVLDYIEQNGWSWSYWTYSIPFRNPEIVRNPDGTLEKRDDSERLTVLKEYWAKNHSVTGASISGGRKKP